MGRLYCRWWQSVGRENFPSGQTMGNEGWLFLESIFFRLPSAGKNPVAIFLGAGKIRDHNKC